jgi:hypothetical protein
MLEAGAEALKNAALLHHPQEARSWRANNWDGAAAIEEMLKREPHRSTLV